MSIIISMNDETYTPCTKCGRPMAYCKGQCCGQPQGCSCQEYGPMKAGCLREIEPSCPYQAVIPTLTVEDKSNLKDLADCFVHVSNINTTFYIDDKHRTIVTWAGPVEYDNYDLDANSLGLRSQFLIDHANDYAAYYNKTGEYQKFNFSEYDAQEKLIHVYLPDDVESVTAEMTSDGYLELRNGVWIEMPDVVIKDDSGNDISPSELAGAVNRLSGYTIAVHVPEYTRLPFDGGYINIAARVYYYNVVLAGETVNFSDLGTGAAYFSSSADHAILGGTDVFSLKIGVLDQNGDGYSNYDSAIVLPIH